MLSNPCVFMQRNYKGDWVSRRKTDAKDRLRHEVNTLARRQVKALKLAMREGMTLVKAREYDSRHKKIAELMKTLAESGGVRHEQEEEDLARHRKESHKGQTSE